MSTTEPEQRTRQRLLQVAGWLVAGAVVGGVCGAFAGWRLGAAILVGTGSASLVFTLVEVITLLHRQQRPEPLRLWLLRVVDLLPSLVLGVAVAITFLFGDLANADGLTDLPAAVADLQANADAIAAALTK